MHQNLLSKFLGELGLQLIAAEIDLDCLRVRAASIQRSASCPQCHRESAKVHSGYERTLADLAFGARKVILHVEVQRFFCLNVACPRVTFAEPLTTLTRRYARRTNQLQQALRALAFELGGEGGAAMLKKLHYGALSPDTLLRMMRQTPQEQQPTPRYLGVDDWAMKKGRRYGTILVDLERHTVVDLLPDRTSDVLAAWLKAHPGVEIITRDRSGSYAEGAAQGAPTAMQVADRFHLLVNLTETLKQTVQGNPGILKLAPPAASPMPEKAEKEPVAERGAEPTPSASLAQKRDLYRQIQELHQQGVPYHEMAKTLGVAINTAMKYANLPEPPAKQIRASRKTSGFEPYLGQRWDEGMRSPKQLFLELGRLGYQGSYQTLARYVAELRGPGRSHWQAQEAPKAPAPKLAVSKAAFLLGKPAEQLKEEEQKLVQHLCQASAQVQNAYELAQAFQKLVRERRADEFDPWLGQAEKSLAPHMRHFATGLRRDYHAVKMALTHSFSNGQVEGQVNRLKLIKRQMQGRAKLDLLRQRVMHTR